MKTIVLKRKVFFNFRNLQMDIKLKNRLGKILGILFLTIVLLLLISPDSAYSRRSFGFGRRSFGGRSRSRLFRSPKRSKLPRSSFGKKRSRSLFGKMTPSQRAARSFGGKRLGNAKQYTRKYGIPRKSFSESINRNGVSRNYVFHSYGGYGSGLMTGYLMGRTSWLWFTPFHPAFYYSRPYYVDNPDGTIGVYPPVFSFSKLIFTILIVSMIIYIIVVVIRSKKSNRRSHSSFSG